MGNFKNKNKEDIKLMIEKGGYLQVPLCNNKRGEIKYIQAHRIVMETWCPRADMWKEKLTVDHLDHNKRNNTTKNLEWVTEKENKKRAAADLLYDNKDALIQSLRDRIRNLEDELHNKLKTDYIKITAVGVKNFTSWLEVKQWLASKNPDYVHTNLDMVKKRITKAYNNNKPYANYYWKINK